ncbi:NADH:flavin oxidoreductase/NADH oxidase family protein [Solimonas marina]|uniref:NADH:flavin oxidoreductase/NADH oxidase family protein n=1 Tax=Solimonas marina TaxID=2714601 RepID=A0A969WAA9_9GAMM|nr:NADH:flavin oxidoreductase/NADH oxidase family protein [Solimonas marina]NKF21210.1 NADH:flavin oxidoreductase/NADH oxidase family protein [Solimonas marina]
MNAVVDPLAQPLNLPCGARLTNRICKAAMTEGLADAQLRPTPRLGELYRRWAEGGAGLLLTGNVQIDRRVLERPGNVAIDPAPANAETLRRLRDWARAGTVAGNHLWMQISHAGRQSPWYVTRQPLAPSAVQLKLLANYAKPRALREDEIVDFIGRYARVAQTARDAGFTGVQIHSAHGYLLSSFLSPITNQRRDAWGGSLENRARMLIETIRATRKAVGNDFPVALKLNSDDFRKGGFTHDECLQLVRWLNDEKLDLLELSGGTYEQPRLLGYIGKASEAVGEQRQSTQQREAYFLDYAADVRKIATMPLMVTGGFRTRAGMEEALNSGAVDVVGLGRPLCGEPDLPKRILARQTDEMPRYEKRMQLGPGILGPTTTVFLFRIINVLGQQGWYYLQLYRLADGLRPNLKLGVFGAFWRYLLDEYRTAWRMHGARRRTKGS